jgi:hypothetical protein
MARICPFLTPKKGVENRQKGLLEIDVEASVRPQDGPEKFRHQVPSGPFSNATKRTVAIRPYMSQICGFTWDYSAYFAIIEAKS